MQITYNVSDGCSTASASVTINLICPASARAAPAIAGVTATRQGGTTLVSANPAATPPSAFTWKYSLSGVLSEFTSDGSARLQYEWRLAGLRPLSRAAEAAVLASGFGGAASIAAAGNGTGIAAITPVSLSQGECLCDGYPACTVPLQYKSCKYTCLSLSGVNSTQTTLSYASFSSRSDLAMAVSNSEFGSTGYGWLWSRAGVYAAPPYAALSAAGSPPGPLATTRLSVARAAALATSVSASISGSRQLSLEGLLPLDTLSLADADQRTATLTVPSHPACRTPVNVRLRVLDTCTMDYSSTNLWVEQPACGAPPVAVAGTSVAAVAEPVGTAGGLFPAVLLDGSSSWDPDTAAADLTFTWTPANAAAASAVRSAALLTAIGSAAAKQAPGVVRVKLPGPGLYEFRLTVDDGCPRATAAVSTVSVSAVCRASLVAVAAGLPAGAAAGAIAPQATGAGAWRLALGSGAKLLLSASLSTTPEPGFAPIGPSSRAVPSAPGTLGGPLDSPSLFVLASATAPSYKYSWALVSAPPDAAVTASTVASTSSSALELAASGMNVPGTYILRAIVRDGCSSSPISVQTLTLTVECPTVFPSAGVALGFTGPDAATAAAFYAASTLLPMRAQTPLEAACAVPTTYEQLSDGNATVSPYARAAQVPAASLTAYWRGAVHKYAPFVLDATASVAKASSAATALTPLQSLLSASGSTGSVSWMSPSHATVFPTLPAALRTSDAAGATMTFKTAGAAAPATYSFAASLLPASGCPAAMANVTLRTACNPPRLFSVVSTAYSAAWKTGARLPEPADAVRSQVSACASDPAPVPVLWDPFAGAFPAVRVRVTGTYTAPVYVEKAGSYATAPTDATSAVTYADKPTTSYAQQATLYSVAYTACRAASAGSSGGAGGSSGSSAVTVAAAARTCSDADAYSPAASDVYGVRGVAVSGPNGACPASGGAPTFTWQATEANNSYRVDFVTGDGCTTGRRGGATLVPTCAQLAATLRTASCGDQSAAGRFVNKAPVLGAPPAPPQPFGAYWLEVVPSYPRAADAPLAGIAAFPAGGLLNPSQRVAITVGVSPAAGGLRSPLRRVLAAGVPLADRVLCTSAASLPRPPAICIDEPGQLLMVSGDTALKVSLVAPAAAAASGSMQPLGCHADDSTYAAPKAPSAAEWATVALDQGLVDLNTTASDGSSPASTDLLSAVFMLSLAGPTAGSITVDACPQYAADAGVGVLSGLPRTAPLYAARAVLPLSLSLLAITPLLPLDAATLPSPRVTSAGAASLKACPATQLSSTDSRNVAVYAPSIAIPAGLPAGHYAVVISPAAPNAALAARAAGMSFPAAGSAAVTAAAVASSLRINIRLSNPSDNTIVARTPADLTTDPWPALPGLVYPGRSDSKLGWLAGGVIFKGTGGTAAVPSPAAARVGYMPLVLGSIPFEARLYDGCAASPASAPLVLTASCRPFRLEAYVTIATAVTPGTPADGYTYQQAGSATTITSRRGNIPSLVLAALPFYQDGTSKASFAGPWLTGDFAPGSPALPDSYITWTGTYVSGGTVTRLGDDAFRPVPGGESYGWLRSFRPPATGTYSFNTSASDGCASARTCSGGFSLTIACDPFDANMTTTGGTALPPVISLQYDPASGKWPTIAVPVRLRSLGYPRPAGASGVQIPIVLDTNTVSLVRATRISTRDPVTGNLTAVSPAQQALDTASWTASSSTRKYTSAALGELQLNPSVVDAVGPATFADLAINQLNSAGQWLFQLTVNDGCSSATSEAATPKTFIVDLACSSHRLQLTGPLAATVVVGGSPVGQRSTILAAAAYDPLSPAAPPSFAGASFLILPPQALLTATVRQPVVYAGPARWTLRLVSGPFASPGDINGPAPPAPAVTCTVGGSTVPWAQDLPGVASSPWSCTSNAADLTSAEFVPNAIGVWTFEYSITDGCKLASATVQVTTIDPWGGIATLERGALVPAPNPASGSGAAFGTGLTGETGSGLTVERLRVRQLDSTSAASLRPTDGNDPRSMCARYPVLRLRASAGTSQANPLLPSFSPAAGLWSSARLDISRAYIVGGGAGGAGVVAAGASSLPLVDWVVLAAPPTSRYARLVSDAPIGGPGMAWPYAAWGDAAYLADSRRLSASFTPDVAGRYEIAAVVLATASASDATPAAVALLGGTTTNAARAFCGVAVESVTIWAGCGSQAGGIGGCLAAATAGAVTLPSVNGEMGITDAACAANTISAATAASMGVLPLAAGLGMTVTTGGAFVFANSSAVAASLGLGISVPAFVAPHGGLVNTNSGSPTPRSARGAASATQPYSAYGLAVLTFASTNVGASFGRSDGTRSFFSPQGTISADLQLLAYDIGSGSVPSGSALASQLRMTRPVSVTPPLSYVTAFAPPAAGAYLLSLRIQDGCTAFYFPVVVLASCGPAFSSIALAPAAGASLTLPLPWIGTGWGSNALLNLGSDPTKVVVKGTDGSGSALAIDRLGTAATRPALVVTSASAPAFFSDLSVTIGSGNPLVPFPGSQYVMVGYGGSAPLSSAGGATVTVSVTDGCVVRDLPITVTAACPGAALITAAVKVYPQDLSSVPLKWSSALASPPYTVSYSSSAKRFPRLLLNPLTSTSNVSGSWKPGFANFSVRSRTIDPTVTPPLGYEADQTEVLTQQGVYGDFMPLVPGVWVVRVTVGDGAPCTGRAFVDITIRAECTSGVTTPTATCPSSTSLTCNVVPYLDVSVDSSAGVVTVSSSPDATPPTLGTVQWMGGGFEPAYIYIAGSLRNAKGEPLGSGLGDGNGTSSTQGLLVAPSVSLIPESAGGVTAADAAKGLLSLSPNTFVFLPWLISGIAAGQAYRLTVTQVAYGSDFSAPCASVTVAGLLATATCPGGSICQCPVVTLQVPPAAAVLSCAGSGCSALTVTSAAGDQPVRAVGTVAFAPDCTASASAPPGVLFGSWTAVTLDATFVASTVFDVATGSPVNPTGRGDTTYGMYIPKPMFTLLTAPAASALYSLTTAGQSNFNASYGSGYGSNASTMASLDAYVSSDGIKLTWTPDAPGRYAFLITQPASTDPRAAASCPDSEVLVELTVEGTGTCGSGSSAKTGAAAPSRGTASSACAAYSVAFKPPAMWPRASITLPGAGSGGAAVTIPDALTMLWSNRSAFLPLPLALEVNATEASSSGGDPVPLSLFASGAPQIYVEAYASAILAADYAPVPDAVPNFGAAAGSLGGYASLGFLTLPATLVPGLTPAALAAVPGGAWPDTASFAPMGISDASGNATLRALHPFLRGPGSTPSSNAELLSTALAAVVNPVDRATVAAYRLFLRVFDAAGCASPFASMYLAPSCPVPPPTRSYVALYPDGCRALSGRCPYLATLAPAVAVGPLGAAVPVPLPASSPSSPAPAGADTITLSYSTEAGGWPRVLLNLTAGPMLVAYDAETGAKLDSSDPTFALPRSIAARTVLVTPPRGAGSRVSPSGVATGSYAMRAALEGVGQRDPTFASATPAQRYQYGGVLFDGAVRVDAGGSCVDPATGTACAVPPYALSSAASFAGENGPTIATDASTAPPGYVSLSTLSAPSVWLDRECEKCHSSAGVSVLEFYPGAAGTWEIEVRLLFAAPHDTCVATRVLRVVALPGPKGERIGSVPRQTDPTKPPPGVVSSSVSGSECAAQVTARAAAGAPCSCDNVTVALSLTPDTPAEVLTAAGRPAAPVSIGTAISAWRGNMWDQVTVAFQPGLRATDGCAASAASPLSVSLVQPAPTLSCGVYPFSSGPSLTLTAYPAGFSLADSPATITPPASVDATGTIRPLVRGSGAMTMPVPGDYALSFAGGNRATAGGAAAAQLQSASCPLISSSATIRAVCPQLVARPKVKFTWRDHTDLPARTVTAPAWVDSAGVDPAGANGANAPPSVVIVPLTSLGGVSLAANALDGDTHSFYIDPATGARVLLSASTAATSYKYAWKLVGPEPKDPLLPGGTGYEALGAQLAERLLDIRIDPATGMTATDAAVRTLRSGSAALPLEQQLASYGTLDNGNKKISGALTLPNVGNYTLELAVSDGCTTAAARITLMVVCEALPPAPRIVIDASLDAAPPMLTASAGAGFPALPYALSYWTPATGGDGTMMPAALTLPLQLTSAAASATPMLPAGQATPNASCAAASGFPAALASLPISWFLLSMPVGSASLGIGSYGLVGAPPATSGSTSPAAAQATAATAAPQFAVFGKPADAWAAGFVAAPAHLNVDAAAAAAASGSASRVVPRNTVSLAAVALSACRIPVVANVSVAVVCRPLGAAADPAVPSVGVWSPAPGAAVQPTAALRLDKSTAAVASGLSIVWQLTGAPAGSRFSALFSPPSGCLAAQTQAYGDAAAASRTSLAADDTAKRGVAMTVTCGSAAPIAAPILVDASAAASGDAVPLQRVTLRGDVPGVYSLQATVSDGCSAVTVPVTLELACAAPLPIAPAASAFVLSDASMTAASTVPSPVFGINSWSPAPGGSVTLPGEATAALAAASLPSSPAALFLASIGRAAGSESDWAQVALPGFSEATGALMAGSAAGASLATGFISSLPASARARLQAAVAAGGAAAVAALAAGQADATAFAFTVDWRVVAAPPASMYSPQALLRSRDSQAADPARFAPRVRPLRVTGGRTSGRLSRSVRETVNSSLLLQPDAPSTAGRVALRGTAAWSRIDWQPDVPGVYIIEAAVSDLCPAPARLGAAAPASQGGSAVAAAGGAGDSRTGVPALPGAFVAGPGLPSAPAAVTRIRHVIVASCEGNLSIAFPAAANRTVTISQPAATATAGADAGGGTLGLRFLPIISSDAADYPASALLPPSSLNPANASNALAALALAAGGRPILAGLRLPLSSRVAARWSVLAAPAGVPPESVPLANAHSALGAAFLPRQAGVYLLELRLWDVRCGASHPTASRAAIAITVACGASLSNVWLETLFIKQAGAAINITDLSQMQWRQNGSLVARLAAQHTFTGGAAAGAGAGVGVRYSWALITKEGLQARVASGDAVAAAARSQPLTPVIVPPPEPLAPGIIAAIVVGSLAAVGLVVYGIVLANSKDRRKKHAAVVRRGSAVVGKAIAVVPAAIAGGAARVNRAVVARRAVAAARAAEAKAAKATAAAAGTTGAAGGAAGKTVAAVGKDANGGSARKPTVVIAGATRTAAAAAVVAAAARSSPRLVGAAAGSSASSISSASASARGISPAASPLGSPGATPRRGPPASAATAAARARVMTAAKLAVALGRGSGRGASTGSLPSSSAAAALRISSARGPGGGAPRRVLSSSNATGGFSAAIPGLALDDGDGPLGVVAGANPMLARAAAMGKSSRLLPSLALGSLGSAASALASPAGALQAGGASATAGSGGSSLRTPSTSNPLAALAAMARNSATAAGAAAAGATAVGASKSGAAAAGAPAAASAAAGAAAAAAAGGGVAPSRVRNPRAASQRRPPPPRANPLALLTGVSGTAKAIAQLKMLRARKAAAAAAAAEAAALAEVAEASADYDYGSAAGSGEIGGSDSGYWADDGNYHYPNGWWADDGSWVDPGFYDADGGYHFYADADADAAGEGEGAEGAEGAEAGDYYGDGYGDGYEQQGEGESDYASYADADAGAEALAEGGDAGDETAE